MVIRAKKVPSLMIKILRARRVTGMNQLKSENWRQMDRCYCLKICLPILFMTTLMRKHLLSSIPLFPMKHGKDIPRNTLLPALRTPFNPVTLRSSINHRSSHPTDAWECLTVTTGRVEVVTIMISTCPIYQTVNVARRHPNQPSTRFTQ